MSVFSTTHYQLVLPYDVQCRVVPFAQMSHLRSPRTHKAANSMSARPASASFLHCPRPSAASWDTVASRSTAVKVRDFAERFDEALQGTLTRMATTSKEMRGTVTKEFFHHRKKWIYTIRTLNLRPSPEEIAAARREREKFRRDNEFVSSKQARDFIGRGKQKR